MTASSGSAAHAAASPTGPLPGRLVVLRAGSPAQAPVLCVHAAGGDVSLYEELARELPAGPAILGVRPPAAGDLVPGPAPTAAGGGLEQLAREHVAAIRVAQPHGPYRLVGECTGGALAYEIARQLEAAGERVSLLALIDALPLWEPPLREVPAPWRLPHAAPGPHPHHARGQPRAPRPGHEGCLRARQGASCARGPGGAGAGAEAEGAGQSQLERPGMKAAFAGYRPAAGAARGGAVRASRLPWGRRAGPDSVLGVAARGARDGGPRRVLHDRDLRARRARARRAARTPAVSAQAGRLPSAAEASLVPTAHGAATLRV